jgi:hypothetical protein
MNKPVGNLEGAEVIELPFAESPDTAAVTEISTAFRKELDEAETEVPGEQPDFWTNSENVIVQDQRGVAAYFNTQGELVLMQRGWPDEDVRIYIAPHSVGAFLDKLTDLCGVPSFP